MFDILGMGDGDSASAIHSLRKPDFRGLPAVHLSGEARTFRLIVIESLNRCGRVLMRSRIWSMS